MAQTNSIIPGQKRALKEHGHIWKNWQIKEKKKCQYESERGQESTELYKKAPSFIGNIFVYNKGTGQLLSPSYDQVNLLYNEVFAD